MSIVYTRNLVVSARTSVIARNGIGFALSSGTVASQRIASIATAREGSIEACSYSTVVVAGVIGARVVVVAHNSLGNTNTILARGGIAWVIALARECSEGTVAGGLNTRIDGARVVVVAYFFVVLANATSCVTSHWVAKSGVGASDGSVDAGTAAAGVGGARV